MKNFNLFEANSPPIAATGCTISAEPLNAAKNTPLLGAGKFIGGFLGCALFFLSGCIFHRPAYYPVRFWMKDGVPCFSVANNRKERTDPPEISIVSIFPYASKGTIAVWEQTFYRDQPPRRLSPLECLVYGAGGDAAPALQHGARYGVSINAAIDGYGVIYKSYFCLYKKSDGQTEIHHAKWDDKKHERDWGMCDD